MSTWELDPAAAAIAADPTAAADAMIAAGATASMAPLDLRGSEVADYAEAVEIAAPFLAGRTTLAVPVAAGPSNPGTGTLAAMIADATKASHRVAVEAAATRLAGWVTAAERIGSLKVYTHRVAAVTRSAEPNDLTAERLFLVEVPKGTGLARKLTDDGARPFALIALFPSRTYRFTDRETGELVDAVDLGNYRPVPVWAGHGGIVRMMTQDQADGWLIDHTYNPDTRNVAWALSTLRRLARIAAARADRIDHADDADEYAEPF